MQGGYCWVLSTAPRGKYPKALTALPTPQWAPWQQWAEDLLLDTCWCSSLRWENTDSQHRGWRGAKGEDMQTRAIKTIPRFSAQTPVPEDSDCTLLRD